MTLSSQQASEVLSGRRYTEAEIAAIPSPRLPDYQDQLSNGAGILE